MIVGVGCRGTEEEVEEVVAKVRMFEFKPDGDVTFMMVQDEQGFPAPVFQDPLHYPHGTKFLAPGLSPVHLYLRLYIRTSNCTSWSLSDGQRYPGSRGYVSQNPPL